MARPLPQIASFLLALIAAHASLAVAGTRTQAPHAGITRAPTPTPALSDSSHVHPDTREPAPDAREPDAREPDAREPDARAPEPWPARIAARDDYATFLVLRAELSQFLSGNGVFRDVLQFVDMLCAQVYAGYIGEQGGSYLRTDFTAPEDPMLHSRRLLGLDGIRPGTGRLRIKTIDGEALSVADPSSPPVSG